MDVYKKPKLKDLIFKALCFYNFEERLTVDIMQISKTPTSIIAPTKTFGDGAIPGSFY